MAPQPEHIKRDLAAKPIRDESYRDVISTVDKHGKRVWVYPKKPSGKFTVKFFRNFMKQCIGTDQD